jgi:hypothetical protein
MTVLAFGLFACANLKSLLGISGTVGGLRRDPTAATLTDPALTGIPSAEVGM